MNREIAKRVLKLWRTGKRQNEIAAELRISRSSAYRYQKALGLHAWQGITETQEAKIAELLFERRWGTSRIASYLSDGKNRVSEHQVLLVKRKLNFQRRKGEPGYRYRMSGAQSLRLIGDILDRTASAAALARRHRTSHKKVLKLAHSLLRCERFLPTWKHPLSSYGPSRPPQPIGRHIPADREQHDEMTALLLRLVDKICARFLSGALPPPANDDNFVKALSTIIIPSEGSPDLQGCPRDAVRKNFETHLHQAIGLLRASQQSAWTN